MFVLRSLFVNKNNHFLQTNTDPTLCKRQQENKSVALLKLGAFSNHWKTTQRIWKLMKKD